MKYTPRNCPGPGDEVTWGPYAGHPLDPRAPAPVEYPVEVELDKARELLFDDPNALEELIQDPDAPVSALIDQIHNLVNKFYFTKLDHNAFKESLEPLVEYWLEENREYVYEQLEKDNA